MTKRKAPAPPASDERVREYRGLSLRAFVIERGEVQRLVVKEGRHTWTLDTYRNRCVIEAMP